MEGSIIAIDPGREKCGIAVVHQQNGVLYRAVVPLEHLPGEIISLMNTYAAALIVLGDGTAHRHIKTLLENSLTDTPVAIRLVDERHSTDEARRRYWRDNPPRGLKRLIPIGLQVPPGPVDDYVAIILAERYWSQTKRSEKTWLVPSP